MSYRKSIIVTHTQIHNPLVLKLVEAYKDFPKINNNSSCNYVHLFKDLASLKGEDHISIDTSCRHQSPISSRNSQLKR